jgi:hypothetical protein
VRETVPKGEATGQNPKTPVSAILRRWNQMEFQWLFPQFSFDCCTRVVILHRGDAWNIALLSRI